MSCILGCDFPISLELVSALWGPSGWRQDSLSLRAIAAGAWVIIWAKDQLYIRDLVMMRIKWGFAEVCRASVHLQIETAPKSTNICTNNLSSGKHIDLLFTYGSALLLSLLGQWALDARMQDMMVFQRTLPGICMSPLGPSYGEHGSSRVLCPGLSLLLGSQGFAM